MVIRPGRERACIHQCHDLAVNGMRDLSRVAILITGNSYLTRAVTKFICRRTLITRWTILPDTEHHLKPGTRIFGHLIFEKSVQYRL